MEVNKIDVQNDIKNVSAKFGPPEIFQNF